MIAALGATYIPFLDGQRVTNETVRGSVVLYGFTYTQCEADCPRLMEKMHEVWQRLDEIDTGDMEVKLVTISIDPERDTPEVMASVASITKRWITARSPATSWITPLPRR